MLRFTIYGFLCLTLAACSTTPGDAAHRGGHYTQAAELYEAGAKWAAADFVDTPLSF
jgi:hypothetical protein